MFANNASLLFLQIIICIENEALASLFLVTALEFQQLKRYTDFPLEVLVNYFYLRGGNVCGKQ